METKMLIKVAMIVYLVAIGYSQQIVTVLDKNMTFYNPYLERVLTDRSADSADITVVVENNTVDTFEADCLSIELVSNSFDPYETPSYSASHKDQSFCQKIKKGANVLIDMSSTSTGPLIRSFARAHGLVYMTMADESLVLPSDRSNPYYVQIQPPGSAMLDIVTDIVTFENLTRVAILYDDSFDLHESPRRIISGLLSHHIYLDVTSNNITELLDIIIHLEIESVFIIASSKNIGTVLGKANAYKDLNNEDINWFAVTKDSNVKCDECSSKMRVVVANADFILSHRNVYGKFMDSFAPGYESVSIKVDEAFAYDLSRLFALKLPTAPVEERNFSCYGDQTFENDNADFNEQFLDNLKKPVDYEGVFGQIVTTAQLIRQKVTLRLSRVIFNKGRPELVSQLGNWVGDKGLNVSSDSLIRNKTRKTYRVVVVPEYEPFIYRHESSNNVSSGGKYSGFCWDLFQEIRKKLDFEAIYYETDDGYFGSLKDDGSWNGAINELIEKNADIAIGPISVMSERENVVDFTVPFHEPVGLTILMKKHKFEYSLHKFLKVLDMEVWGVIFASFFLFSILMWLFDKFSPYSYQNNPSSSSGPEKRIFTLKESIWFCMTSLTPQGGGEAPKAISGRLVAAFWWLYGFLLIAFYTANLAAFLTVTRLETPISSLDDLSKQQSVKYGPMNGTSALVYFNRMKEIEEQFYKIWKDMSLNDSLSPVARAKLAVWDYPVSEQFTKLMSRMKVAEEHSEALAMVKRGEFAFIDDATRNKYQTLTDCDVEEIGEEFSRKPFAFAVSQGSPLRAQMSNVILELANNRVLEDLTNKWWDSNSKKKTCPRIEDESDGISINNIGGVFLVIAIGTVLSLIAFIMEYYYYKIKPRREARLYSIHRHTGANKTQSETTLNDIQLQPTEANQDEHKPESNGSLGGGLSKRRKQGNGSTHNSVKHEHHGHRNDTNERNGRNSLPGGTGNHHLQNGHVHTNGGVNNTYFVFDTDETIAERYPDIYEASSVQTALSERL